VNHFSNAKAGTMHAPLKEKQARVKQMIDDLRRQVDLLARVVDDKADGHIPECGRVRIIAKVPGAEELQGKTGVALAGGPDAAGNWTYTVLVDSLNETYVLPESALSFLGWTVPQDQMYATRPIRVRVDNHGRGSIVRRAKKKTR
jgi:hypothetical protein